MQRYGNDVKADLRFTAKVCILANISIISLKIDQKLSKNFHKYN